MSSWRECKLGDILELITKGTTPPNGQGFVNLGINYIKSDAINYNGKIDKSKFVQIDLETHEKFKRSQLEEFDILFSMAGAYLGKNAIVTSEILPANTNQALAILRLNQTLAIPRYVSYYLSQNEIIDFVNNMSGQSAQPNINFQEISSIPLLLPPLEEQKAIAEVLSSLDDKIDFLHRQNQTLESLTQTLFRQWFIEEAKEEWEEVTLSDVMELKYGKDHKHLNDGKIPIYGSGGIMRYGNTAIYENESILIPRKGTLSNIFYVDEPFWTVDTIFWSKINSEKISGKLLFEFLKTLNFSNMNVGSAVPSLTTKVLNEISFALPSLKEQEEFKQYTDDAWDKVKQNKKQIQTLENLRDTLLPKLLSGEVRVKI